MPSSRALIGILALLASPAFAAKPQIQWNPYYDFSQIKTFMWKPTAGASLEQVDPPLHQHIINAIEFHLSGSGLTEVDADPDVLVTYYGTIDTELRLQSDIYGYGWGGFGGPNWSRYGYGMGAPISTAPRAVEYDRGTLVVDIVDAASSELIWRGVASDLDISNNPDKLRKTIEKTLENMVKQSQKLRAEAAQE